MPMFNQSPVSGVGFIRTTDEPVLLTGDSITAGAIAGATNPGNHINYQCAGRWFIAANRGTGGQTSAVIAARLADDMKTYGCKTVVALSFTYNDIGTGMTLQQSIDAWSSMRDTVKSAGGRLYMCSPTPDGLSYGLPRAGVDSRWWALRSFCAANNITFIDLRRTINSGSGVIASAYNVDGSVHPNEDGNVAIATPVAAALNVDFPGDSALSTLDAADSNDLLAGAGLFRASTGGVGTGWGYSGATGATASVASGVQTIACVGMSSGTAYLDKSIGTGWSVGDVLEIRAHISSAGGAVYPRLRTVLSGAGSNYVLHEMRKNLPASPVVLRQKIYSGVTGVALRLQAAGNGDGTVSFSRISVRNVTALGLV